MRVGDVLPHPMNPKIHPEGQLAPLRGLLETVGKLDDLKAYRSERAGGALVFFDGHGRQSLDPNAEWDVDIYDLTDAEADLAVATFDPIGWQAEQSRVMLDQLLREVSTGDAALQKLLSDVAEESGLYFGNESKAPGAGGDDFDMAPDEEQTRVMYGDIWACGEHRVLCGDSTKAEDVERLMVGQKAAASITDPPYNVGISYGENYSDQQSFVEYQEFSRQWSALALQNADGLVFTPGTGRGLVNFPLWFAIGMPYWMAIWVKKNTTTHSCIGGFQAWEPILIYNKPKKKIGQDIYDIPIGMQFHDGQPLNELHPTPKILKLWETLISDFTDVGNLIYEPFGGSGTTLVACQRTSRTARVIEIEPKYVNVILSRWEAETGKKAELLERLDG